MIVAIVIASQAYGFGSTDPIAFETTEEAREYISLRMKADELEGIIINYALHIVTVQSKRKRLLAREKLNVLRAEKEKENATSGS